MIREYDKTMPGDGILKLEAWLSDSKTRGGAQKISLNKAQLLALCALYEFTNLISFIPKSISFIFWHEYFSGPSLSKFHELDNRVGFLFYQLSFEEIDYLCLSESGLVNYDPMEEEQYTTCQLTESGRDLIKLVMSSEGEAND